MWIMAREVTDALVRETREELGLEIEAGDARLLRRYVFESDRERELVNAYMLVSDRSPAPTDELDGGRFWCREEILSSIGREVFTPNFEREYMMLFGKKIQKFKGQKKHKFFTLRQRVKIIYSRLREC